MYVGLSSKTYNKANSLGQSKASLRSVLFAGDLRRAQPIRLRLQQVKVLPWELSVHPGSNNRLMKGRPDMGKLGRKSPSPLRKYRGSSQRGEQLHRP